MTRHSTDILVPFPIRAGPGEVLPTTAWTETLTAVRNALESGSTVLLTGAPGVGKSLLLRCLRRDLAGSDCTVLLIPGETGSIGQPPNVLLLDDADRIPEALLTQLLAKVERSVLVGSSALLDRTGRCGTRIRSVMLRALTPPEVADFICAELRRVGLPETVFEPDAVDLLVRHTGGGPAAIRIHAALALFLARLDSADCVTAAHLADALDRTGTVPLSDDPPAPAPDEPASIPATPAVQSRPPLLSPPVTTGSSAMRLGRVRVWSLSKPAGLAAAGLAVIALLAAVTSQLWPDPVRPDSSASPNFIATSLEPALPVKPEPLETVASAVKQPEPVAAAPQVRPLDRTPEMAQTQASPPTEIELARPPDQPIRVIVAVQGRAAASRGSAVVQALRDRGLAAMLDPAPARARDPEIGYFYPEDGPAADSLAREIAGSTIPRLIAAPAALPRPGTIRLSLRASPSPGNLANFEILVTSEHR